MTASPLSSARMAVLGALVMLSSVALRAGQEPRVAGTSQSITLLPGRSTVLATDFDVVRVAITDSKIANAVVVRPREILIDGKSAGIVSLIVWGTTARRQYDVIVDPGAATLQQQLRELFPGEDIQVSVSDEAIVLSGRVSTTAVMNRAAEVAQASSSKRKVVNLLDVPGDPGSQAVATLQQQFRLLFPREGIQVSGSEDALVLSGQVSTTAVMTRAAEVAAAWTPKSKVVNLLQLPGGDVNQQVMLQVRFAEVDRTALTELGASLFALRDFHARTSTQQFPAPNFDTERGGLVFSDFLNLYFLGREGVGGVIKALQQRGYFHSLAEPNLIAYNGQEASFLAGGEFPVPVVQGGAGTTTVNVTIQWKEFGVRLTFRPTILGDSIRLNVEPEVSTLDFENAIVLQGFRIPAVSTRRAKTDVELKDGQSFAIAGLLKNEAGEQAAKIPVLGNLPIIGPLFKSRATRQNKTELLVLITPKLVRPLEADELPPLPVDPTLFMAPAGKGKGKPGQTPGGLVDAPSKPRTAGGRP